jgi:hypothetical protein
MPSIADFPITKYQRQYIQAPLEVDLLAFFIVAKDEILELLAKAEEDGWNADEFTAEVDMLLDGTGERIEFQRMVIKARGFPDYTMRQHKDGYWYIKLPGKGWRMCGGPNDSDLKAILAPAGLARPPHIIPYDPAAPDGAGASLHPSEEPAKKRKEALMQWRKDDPDAFHSAIAHAVEAKVGGHPLFNKDDIKAKLAHGTLDPDQLAEIADQYGVEPPNKWEDLPKQEKMKQDRDRFIDEIMAVRNKNKRLSPTDAQRVKDRYKGYDDDNLLERARIYLGEGPETKKRAAEEKARKLANAKAVDDRKDELRKEYDADRSKIKDLSYKQAAGQHPSVLIKKILWAEDFDNVAALEKQMSAYKKMNTSALVRRAEMHLGRDDVHEAHQLVKKQAEYKKILTGRSRMHDEKAEAHLAESPEGSKPREILGSPSLNNVNITYKIWLKDAQGNETPAVWKAANKEYKGKVRNGIPAGEQWIRERGAYEVNAIVGLGNSPPVVLRDIPGDGVGACMGFVPGRPWCEAGADYIDFPANEWKKLALHGYLIGTEDMHAKNFMADVKTKKLYCIDNGLTLPEHKEWYRNKAHDKLRAYGDLDLPDEIADLVTEEKRDKAVAATKHLGLGQDAIDAMKDRFDYIIKNRELP